MRKVGMMLALLCACGGGEPAPQTTTQDAGNPPRASDGGTSDGGTADGGGTSGPPKCSPAGAVKCGGDGDGDGTGDGDVFVCDPIYGWLHKQTCQWSCQDGACGVCALENQSCRYSSDCKQEGYGLITCIEVGGSRPCGSSNVTDCNCIYAGYSLGCVESIECAPGRYCASDGICRQGCYAKGEPCFSDDQCCSGTCQTYPDQCSGDCA